MPAEDGILKVTNSTTLTIDVDRTMSPPHLSVGERSIAMSVSVCLHVCVSLSARISLAPHIQTSPHFRRMLPVQDMARFFSGGVGTRYVQGGPKSCTSFNHYIYATVQDKLKRFHQNVPRVSANKDSVAVLCS